MKKLIIFFLVVIFVLSMSLVSIGCKEEAVPTEEVGEEAAEEEAPAEEDSASADGNKGTIVFLNYVNAHPYFVCAKETAIAVGDELGYEVTYDGPPNVDTPQFVSMIEDYTSKDIDALIIAAMDDTATPALKAAREKGITVVTWDLDTPSPEARDLYAGIGDLIELLGKGMAESLVMNIGEEGDYVLVDGDPSVEILIERGDYVVEYLKENYPGLNCVAREPAGEDVEKSRAIVDGLLTAYPDIEGIVVLTSSAFGPACKAIEENGLIGQVYVSGECFDNMGIPGFEAGASKAAFTWNVKKWAEFAVKVAVNQLEGVEMPDGSLADIFPNFPEATKQGDILYFGAGDFMTPDNVEEFLWQ